MPSRTCSDLSERGKNSDAVCHPEGGEKKKKKRKEMSSKPPPYGSLVLITSSGADGKSMLLRKSTYTFGTNPECEVQLRVSDVDPEHARITHDPATGATRLHCLAPTKPLKLGRGGADGVVDTLKPFDLVPGTIFSIQSKTFKYDIPRARPAQPAAAAAAAAQAKRTAPAEHPKAAKSKKRKSGEPPRPREQQVAATAPAGTLMRFSRAGTVGGIPALDVESVSVLCRKFHIQHSALNSLVTAKEGATFRNWRYHGIVDAVTKEPRPDLRASLQPIVPKTSTPVPPTTAADHEGDDKSDEEKEGEEEKDEEEGETAEPEKKEKKEEEGEPKEPEKSV